MSKKNWARLIFMVFGVILAILAMGPVNSFFKWCFRTELTSFNILNASLTISKDENYTSPEKNTFTWIFSSMLFNPNTLDKEAIIPFHECSIVFSEATGISLPDFSGPDFSDNVTQSTKLSIENDAIIITGPCRLSVAAKAQSSDEDLSKFQNGIIVACLIINPVGQKKTIKIEMPLRFKSNDGAEKVSLIYDANDTR